MRKSMWKAILGDIQLWIPVGVLSMGLLLLAVLA
jgi:hypothetical protein